MRPTLAPPAAPPGADNTKKRPKTGGRFTLAPANGIQKNRMRKRFVTGVAPGLQNQWAAYPRLQVRLLYASAK